ncbi:MAG: MBL fold metallo-hydrolase [Aggregatilineales bacterium]
MLLSPPTTTVLPGLHRLALPTPFPVGPINVYIDEHDPLTVIDCGTALDDSYEALRAGLAALGYRPSDVRRLLITHHHIDHVGSAGRLEADVRAAGADLEIIAHPLTVAYIETPQAAHDHSRAYLTEIFRAGGAPSKILEMMRLVDTYMLSLVGAAHVTRTINEGDSLALAGRTWRVLHTPGHAGDLICLSDPDSGVLLSSDHVLGRISSNPLLEPPDYPNGPRPRRLIDYERELLRVAALKPTIAYPGHDEPVQNVVGLIAERVEHRKARTEKLWELFDGQPKTLYELSRRLFPKASEPESLLTLSETIGHLDILEQDSRVTPITRADRIIEWQPL